MNTDADVVEINVIDFAAVMNAAQALSEKDALGFRLADSTMKVASSIHEELFEMGLVSCALRGDFATAWLTVNDSSTLEFVIDYINDGPFGKCLVASEVYPEVSLTF